ncbi:SVM family protein [Bacteroides salyersiae]
MHICWTEIGVCYICLLYFLGMKFIINEN